MQELKSPQRTKKRESDLNQRLFPFEIVHINEPANNMAFFHWHEYMELSYVKEGRGLYEIEDKKFEVERGDIVVINNIERHRVTYNPKQPLYETVLHFAPSLIWSKENSYFDHTYLELFLYSGAGFNNRLKLEPEIQPKISVIIDEIVEEYLARRQYYELMIKSKLLTLITHLIRSCGIKSSSQDEYLYRKKNIERLEEILKYINANFFEDVALGSIAQRFFMSPAYFSDFFKKNIGINFSDYLTRSRITESIRLLNENRLNTTEIAFTVGFKNLPSFYAAFKRIAGKNPGQYRKSLRSKQTK
ncbi:MAG: helix-turn-helix transcriptional regulator [Spirochaetaceae bacterium]|nr:MAG: helix-turn-helix transcriptional regulator [Spirochaetaceae bacterium]